MARPQLLSVVAIPNIQAHRLLDAFLADPGVETLEDLLRWLLAESPLPIGNEIPRTRRLALLAEVMRAHPRQADLLEHLRATWTHGSTVRLLAETGLPVHVTLTKEAIERLVDRFVPRTAPDDDLYVLLSQLRLVESDAAWIEGLSDEAIAPWRGLVALPRRVLLDGAQLLARRTSAVGLARDVLELTPGQAESSSPFFTIASVVDDVAGHADADGMWAEWRNALEACRAALREKLGNLERKGVSTDLIYRLDLLEAQLDRLHGLLEVGTGRGDGRALASQLIRASIRQHGIRSLVGSAVKRLARKVVEHAGNTGEHYVVRNRLEWTVTGVTAGLAGILTAFTALGKYGLGALPLSPMVLGLGLAVNYAVSFILLQLFHLTLASKQPANSAAALANALEYRRDVADQVELVAGITRSQVVATIGNVLVTIPVSVALVAIGWLLAGDPLLSPETAVHTVHTMHPFLSWTIPFAALTGVFLWLASLAAGWAANWSAFRGLPQAVRKLATLRAAVGEERAAKLGTFIENHFSGIVGYCALGFLLGFMPVLFRFMGLHIEVRHVTLGASSYALALTSLYGTPEWHWGDVGWGLLTVAMMSIFNFGVSFALALRTAMRARDLGRAERARLWAAIRHAFRAEPRRFLWQPRE
jgi:site-specific recombinase